MVEVEQQKLALGANSDQDVKPNKRFRNFNDVFSGLTRSKNVVTQYPLINCMISYDSKCAITIEKNNDREYWVKMFSLETFVVGFEEKFGGNSNSYIKLREVEQRDDGQFFAVSYLDDGIFKLRTFGKEKRSEQEIKDNDFNINDALNLDNHTMPIDNFPDPFIACVFVSDQMLFVNLFHNASLTHHHFFFNIET